MINTKTIESLASSLAEQLPSGLGTLKTEAEKNFKAILQQQFSKLDLVTREEFDTQNAVLTRTRDKLNALEKAVDELTKK